MTTVQRDDHDESGLQYVQASGYCDEIKAKKRLFGEPIGPRLKQLDFYARNNRSQVIDAHM